MTGKYPIRFDTVVVNEQWGHATPERFVVDDDPRTPGSDFSVCIIASESIAVFLGGPGTSGPRGQLASHRPEWLAAIVFADVASRDPSTAVIDAAVAPPEADLPRCAVAAACVAFESGAFDQSPRRYLIRFTELHTSLDVRIQFDEDSESWQGEVSNPL